MGYVFRGKPRKIKNGSVRREPLPAKVFINPAIKPTKITAI